jgi:hypothetical protein
VIFLILRLLWRAARGFQGHPSTGEGERVTDAAAQLGSDSGAVGELFRITIGEPIRDLGLVERRTCGEADIEYSAQLCRVEDELRLVLSVKDEATSFSAFSLSKDREQYRIPISKKAADALASILEVDEENFMGTAAAYDSLVKLKQSIGKDRVAKIKDTVLRWFAFLPLKDFGQIDVLTAIPRAVGGKEIRYELGINAYIGKEADEIILVLRFEMKYTETGRSGQLHYILYYPFGEVGRVNLRRMLLELV